MSESWRSRLAVAFAVTFAAACAACGGDATDGATRADAGAPPAGLTPDQAARVVAKVGDRTITLGDYATTLERMDQFDRLRYQTKEARRELLKEMIDVELLAQEARKRKLDEQPATRAAVRQLLGEALMSDLRASLPPPAELTAEEVAGYYAKHKEDFREPERRRVAVVAFSDEKLAKEALETLRKAKKDDGTVEANEWGKLVAEQGATAPKNARTAPADLAGDLGIVGPPDDDKGANPRVPESVRKAVFTLPKVGAFVDDLVADKDRFYVVRLSGLTAAHERTLAEADRTIRVAILRERLVEMERKLEAELRKKYEVAIDDGALAKIPPPETAKAAASGADFAPPDASGGPTELSDPPRPAPSSGPSVPSSAPSSAPKPE
jgi:peptidyl-prolyl cis-trans isomerase C